MRELQTNSHCKNLILYHLIFVCKYRRKCFSNTDFAENLKLQFFEIAKKYDFEMDTIDLDYSKPDHIHILVRSVPKLSPLQIVRVLKQQKHSDIANIMRKNNKNRHFSIYFHLPYANEYCIIICILTKIVEFCRVFYKFYIQY